jgi:hypothetical protein
MEFCTMENNPIDLQPIPLPKLLFDRSATVFEALKTRKTSRNIGANLIPL